MPRIIKNISDRFNAAAKSSSSKKTDTLGAVTKLLGANFDKVEVGGGMAFPVKEGDTGKGLLASIRAKLVSVVREGEPWAGRVYRTRFDEAANEVLVMREADGNPLPKKVGGRGKGTTKSKDSPAVIKGMEAAKAHLSGGNKTTTDVAKDVEKVETPNASNDKTNDTKPGNKVKDLTGGKKNEDKAAA